MSCDCHKCKADHPLSIGNAKCQTALNRAKPRQNALRQLSKKSFSSVCESFFKNKQPISVGIWAKDASNLLWVKPQESAKL